MLSKTCENCAARRAIILRPKNQRRLCKECFIEVFETEIHETIVSSQIFLRRGERVAIGASGGKDSTVLAAVLKTLNERHDYGVEFILLSVDEGIHGYRDDSLETVKRNATQYQMELHITGYNELYGWTMDQVVEQIGKKGNCTYCGVFRRQALDRGAAKLGIKHILTGHNVDDIAETILMNFLRADLPRLGRCSNIMTSANASMMRRSKPLKYAYEKEIVLYAHHRNLDYFSTECIYSPEAFRGTARTLIKALEKSRPSSIIDIVRSGECLALVAPTEENPAEKSTPNCSAQNKSAPGRCQNNISRQHGDKDAKSRDGKTCRGIAPTSSGGDDQMLEEATALTGSFRSLDMYMAKKVDAVAQATKKQNKQRQMGTCKICGYLSSQDVCKACMLLDSLNKSKPSLRIDI